MVIHTLDTPESAVSEMARVLKPEAKLYLGIVHPEAEVWNIKDKLCRPDTPRYNNVDEARPWIFNLTNGESFVKHYFHRRREDYERMLSQHFSISRVLEPELQEDMLKNGRYAQKEYLFMELTKK